MGKDTQQIQEIASLNISEPVFGLKSDSASMFSGFCFVQGGGRGRAMPRASGKDIEV